MYHFIVNPVSKSGRGLHLWKTIIEPTLQQKKIVYQVHLSERAGEIPHLAKQIAKEAGEEPVTMVILGGDGSFNEALQGISDFSGIHFGYIPTGSSNDLARDLGIPQDPLYALERILNASTVHPMDLGCVSYREEGNNGSEGKRLFAVSCGIGFDAAVCADAMHSKMKDFLNKIHLGKLTYMGIALKQIFTARRPEAVLTLDDNSKVFLKKFLFTACMNHRFEGGGFRFCPDADDQDGILNLCTVSGLSKPMVCLALPSAFPGKHYRFKGVKAYRGQTVHIHTGEPLWVHTDGEAFIKTTDITFSCLPQALHMIY